MSWVLWTSLSMFFHSLWPGCDTKFQKANTCHPRKRLGHDSRSPRANDKYTRLKLHSLYLQQERSVSAQDLALCNALDLHGLTIGLFHSRCRQGNCKHYTTLHCSGKASTPPLWELLWNTESLKYTCGTLTHTLSRTKWVYIWLGTWKDNSLKRKSSRGCENSIFQ